MSVQGEEGEIEEGEIGGPPQQQTKRRIVLQNKGGQEGALNFPERQAVQRGGGGAVGRTGEGSVSGVGSQSDDDVAPQQMFPIPPPPPPPPPPVQFSDLVDRRSEMASRRFKDHSPKPRPRRSDIDMVLEVHRRYPPRREIPPPPSRIWEHENPPLDRHRRDFSPEPRQRMRLLPEERFRDRHLPPFPEPPFRRPRPPPSPIPYPPSANPRREFSPPRREVSPPRKEGSPLQSPRPSLSKVEADGKVVGKSTSQSSSESSQNPSSSNEKSSEKNLYQASKEIGEVSQRSFLKNESSNLLQRRLHQPAHFHELQYHHRIPHYHHHHPPPHHHPHYVSRVPSSYRGYQDLSEFNDFDKRRYSLRGRPGAHGGGGFHPYDYYSSRDGRGEQRERVRELMDRRRGRYPYELDRVEELVEDIRILTDQVGAEDARKDLRGVCDRLVQAISKMEQLEPMLLKRYGAIRVQDVPNFSFISRRIFSGLKTLASLAEHDDQPGQLSLISHTLHQAAEIKHKILNILDQKEFEELLSSCVAAANRGQHPSGSDSDGGSSSLSKRKERESSISKQNNNLQKENEGGKVEDGDDADFADSKCRKYEKEEDEEMSFPKGFGLHASERENGNVTEGAEKRNVESFALSGRTVKSTEDTAQGSPRTRPGTVPVPKVSIRSQVQQFDYDKTESFEDALPPNKSPRKQIQIEKWVPNKDPRLAAQIETKDKPKQLNSGKNGLNNYQLKAEAVIYQHEMPCEEPVTPESIHEDDDNDQPFLVSKQVGEKETVLVFPPESPVTSPLDSYDAQYDEYENGNYQYNYDFNEEISMKKSFNVVFQVEGVLVDIIDRQAASSLLLLWIQNENDNNFAQNCLLTPELLLFEDKLIKLRPGVRENLQKWEQQNISVTFFSQLGFAKQIIELFQIQLKFFDGNYLFLGSQQEVEDMVTEFGEILWVGHTVPKFLKPLTEQIQFQRVMGYSYFPKVLDSQIVQQDGSNFFVLKADENRLNNTMADLNAIFGKVRCIYFESPIFTLHQCFKGLKERVLKGVVLIVNINQNKVKKRLTEIGFSLGAQIVDIDSQSRATHAVVVNCKSREQVLGIESGLQIVDGSWLLCCEVRMKKANEESFRIN